MGGKDQTLSTSTVTGPKQSGGSSTIGSAQVIQGSFSVINPTFSIQVMDADDPNRIIRTITPHGGLDSSLWKDTTVEGDYSGSTIIKDPRLWKERFF